MLQLEKFQDSSKALNNVNLLYLMYDFQVGRAWPLALGKMILEAYSFDFKIQEHALDS